MRFSTKINGLISTDFNTFKFIKISYKEKALNNITFCFSQIGNGIKAKEFYERTLSEFLESGIAKAELNMLNSMNHNEPRQN